MRPAGIEDGSNVDMLWRRCTTGACTAAGKKTTNCHCVLCHSEPSQSQTPDDRQDQPSCGVADVAFMSPHDMSATVFAPVERFSVLW